MVAVFFRPTNQLDNGTKKAEITRVGVWKSNGAAVFFRSVNSKKGMKSKRIKKLLA